MFCYDIEILVLLLWYRKCLANYFLYRTTVSLLSYIQNCFFQVDMKTNASMLALNARTAPYGSWADDVIELKN